MNCMIRRMTSDDLRAALAFCRHTGWNQVEDDWSRLLRYEPHGCFVAEVDAIVAGTVTTTCYGTDLAWIGMMLVAPPFRRCGVATQLMQSALEYCRGRQVSCVKLDATPDGRFVYRKLGFRDEQTFMRFERTGTGSQHRSRLTCSDRLSDGHLEIDRKAFGADRSEWLAGLAGASRVVAIDGGFGMLRSGHLADYIGPLVAADDNSAEAIFDELLRQSESDRVFCDIFNQRMIDLAEQRGFAPARKLIRMQTGRSLSTAPPLQYAIADPGTG